MRSCDVCGREAISEFWMSTMRLDTDLCGKHMKQLMKKMWKTFNDFIEEAKKE